MENSAEYMSTDPESLFQWFLDQVPNIREEEKPTLRMGCHYLAKFNEINEMDLDLTIKDRDADRLNPILRHQKACFDAWLAVARRFGLTTLDAPKRPARPNSSEDFRRPKTPFRRNEIENN